MVGLVLKVMLDSGLGYPLNDNHACIHGIHGKPTMENVRRTFHASIYPCGSHSNGHSKHHHVKYTHESNNDMNRTESCLYFVYTRTVMMHFV